MGGLSVVGYMYTGMVASGGRAGVARYVGSGAAGCGIHTRLEAYPSIVRGKIKNWKGRHTDWLRRKDVQMSLPVALCLISV